MYTVVPLGQNPRSFLYWGVNQNIPSKKIFLKTGVAPHENLKIQGN